MKKILLLLLMLMSVNLMQAREITRPQVETTPPVVTVIDDPEAQTVTVTATGNGHICLYWDDMLQVEGEGVAVWVIPYTDDPEGEEYGVSATAQEEGYEVSDYALATVYVPGKSTEPYETPAPVINVTETEDAYIIEAVGEGEVILYVNDEPVENPFTIARPEPGEEDIVIYVYATAQNPGEEMGTSDVERIEITPKEDEFPVDPHAYGVWIVLRDRNGQEVWKEMMFDNGDYTTTIRLTNTYFGDFNSESNENFLVPLYIVFEGIRFGAPSPNCPINFGYENILIENNHCYVIETGYRYIIGVTFFDDFYENGNLYLYVVRLPLNSEDDPIDPHESGYWVVLRDRHGQEVWQEFKLDDGDYTTLIRLNYSVYGGYNPETEERPGEPLFIVIDGIKYGAPSANTEVVLGVALDNPLVEGENYYVLEEALGKVYNLGVAVDPETGNKYLYAAAPGVPGGYVTGEDPRDYITGDVDGNAKVTIADVITMIDYLLSGHSTGINMDNADVDGSGKVTIEDVTLLIDYLLKGSWW